MAKIGEVKIEKYPEKSIWLTCRTCRPERWVCSKCRKRKEFLKLCPMRRIILKEIKSIDEILPPARP